MHILPPPGASKRASDVQPLDLPAALTALQSPSMRTEASEKVQQAITKRLEGFPEKPLSASHSARCRVPIRVAQVRVSAAACCCQCSVLRSVVGIANL